jgi:iron complex outermembrane receptor protein
MYSNHLRFCIAAILIASAQAAGATEADDSAGRSLDPVLVTAQALHGPQDMPSQGSLVAVQPQSIVGADFIQNNESPAANYTDIIKFTPSVWTVDPNGPGLMENLGTSIRGFQDGQFNVTFDGIPWGDSNDFTHHSTSYFMAQDVGNVVVDRGPGNAGTLGDATFGGTIYVQSADPKRESGLTTWLSIGSFDTRLFGARYDTGEVSEWGGTRAFISLKTISSEGYLSNANLDRSNAFVKIIQPLNDSTNLTFASNLNKLHQNPPIGATFAQIQAFGANYAYNRDPTSQSYFGYNLDRITTDYEYLGLNSKFLGWTVDNKVYTYAYFHDGFNGEDVNGQSPDGTYLPGEQANGTVYGANNVPGQQLTNNYRSVGDILRLSHDVGPGELQFGGWFDHQSNLRALYEIDFSNNNAFNPIFTVAPGQLPVEAYTDRLMDNQLFTRQVFGQYIWHVVTDLDVTGGVKHVSFERDINAAVNQGGGHGFPLTYDETWTRNLSSLDAHYKLADNWSLYAQWAQGFLAPNMNVLYTQDPSQSHLDPQSTTNIQAGTTWVGNGLTVSVDAYTINFNNLITSVNNGNIKVFSNFGGAKYRGFEGEATFVLGAGFSLYGNASWNSAHSTVDDSWVPNTPDRTDALGLIYHSGALQASLIGKYVGANYESGITTVRLGGYGTADAAVNYDFKPSGIAVKDLKLGVTVQNIADRKSIYFLNGTTGGGASNLYFTLPGISFQVNLTASF